MDTKQAQLYAKILAFEFDEPGTCRTFAARLTEENGWSAEFADRALFEYRRFLFLTMAAGHVVCPSEEVDEVWHLHLIYSRSYWERLCGEVLGCPLHHDPSRGGGAEFAKHQTMYDQTLASYRRLFEDNPPADLWPDCTARFAPRDSRRTVDASDWRIRKPAIWRSVHSWWRTLGTGAAFTSMAAVPLLGVAIDHPFNMHGPEFLAFYAALLLIAFGTAGAVRMLARRSSGVDSNRLGPLDPYQAAYLSGGAAWAVKTALARMLADREIIVTRTTPLRVGRFGAVNTTGHSLERALSMAMPAAPEGASQGGLTARTQDTLASLGESLQARGLLMTPQRATIAHIAPLVIMAAAIAFGLIKIVVGLERHRPVGFLCLMCLFAVIVTLIAFVRRVSRTRAGDQQLLSLKVGHQHLRKEARESELSAQNALPLAVALFGFGVLLHGPHQSLARSLDPGARIDYPKKGHRLWGNSCGGIGVGCGGGAGGHLGGGGHGCGGGGGGGGAGCGGGGGGGGGGCGGGGCGGCGGS